MPEKTLANVAAVLIDVAPGELVGAAQLNVEPADARAVVATSTPARCTSPRGRSRVVSSGHAVSLYPDAATSHAPAATWKPTR